MGLKAKGIAALLSLGPAHLHGTLETSLAVAHLARMSAESIKAALLSEAAPLAKVSDAFRLADATGHPFRKLKTLESAPLLAEAARVLKTVEAGLAAGRLAKLFLLRWRDPSCCAEGDECEDGFHVLPFFLRVA